MKKNNGFFTVRQASVILGIKVRTVRHWISNGKLIAKKESNRWLISEEEVYNKEIQKNENKNRKHSERIEEGKKMGMLHGDRQDPEEPV